MTGRFGRAVVGGTKCWAQGRGFDSRIGQHSCDEQIFFLHFGCLIFIRVHI